MELRMEQIRLGGGGYWDSTPLSRTIFFKWIRKKFKKKNPNLNFQAVRRESKISGFLWGIVL